MGWVIVVTKILFICTCEFWCVCLCLRSLPRVQRFCLWSVSWHFLVILVVFVFHVYLLIILFSITGPCVWFSGICQDWRWSQAGKCHAIRPNKKRSVFRGTGLKILGNLGIAYIFVSGEKINKILCILKGNYIFYRKPEKQSRFHK